MDPFWWGLLTGFLITEALSIVTVFFFVRRSRVGEGG